MNKFLLGLVLGTLLGLLFARSVGDKDNPVSTPADIRSTPVNITDRPKLISEPVGHKPIPATEGSSILSHAATSTQSAAPDSQPDSRPFSQDSK